ncbi:MAG: M48 family metallopeptidase [Woeseiaceae bacterium]|nr:M48 family metallopeptidase [Woeseiaceae bacterium]
MNRPVRLALLTALLPALALAACSTSPTGRQQLVLKSEAELEREGTRQFRMIQEQAPLVSNGNTIDYVACVADAIVGVLEGDDADMYWEMAIVDQPDINAHVLPGGKMVVKAGILRVAENQHQLAAVLGHEVAHVTARHADERASRHAVTGVGIDIAAILLGGGYRNQTRGAYEALSAGAALGIMNPFSRKQETEADVIGLHYMAKAGFDPRQSVELWKNMNARNQAQIPEYMSTHPSGDTRIQTLVAEYPTALALYNEAQAAGRNPDCEP